MTDTIPSQLTTIGSVRELPIQQRISWLFERARRHAEVFESPDSDLARRRHIAKHPTAIVSFDCMDGRVNISVATDTPPGIIFPFRNLGGRFDLGWPYFGELLTKCIDNSVNVGRRTLLLITYHYSKGDSHRGCAGFGYDTNAARNHTYELKTQMEIVFGNQHNTVYPLVCGFETDEDTLILHGTGREVLDLSTVSTTNLESLPGSLARLYPDMPDQMREDLLPLVAGNVLHTEKVRQSNREVEFEHHEWIIGVGRGFDWLHAPNLELIIGPYSPDLDDPIRKAAGIIEANMKKRRIPDDGFLLLTASPYQEIGAERARAELRSRVFSKLAVSIIHDEYPYLASKMLVRSATIAWQSRTMHILE